MPVFVATVSRSLKNPRRPGQTSLPSAGTITAAQLVGEYLWYPTASHCGPTRLRLTFDPGLPLETMWGGRFKSFRERVLANLEKMKAVVHGRHAIGELRFSPAMGASVANQIEWSKMCHWIWKNTWATVMKVMRMISSTKYNRLVRRKVDHLLEVFTPTLESVQVKVEVLNALAVLRTREETRAQPRSSIYQQVLMKLRQHPGVATSGLDFIFSVMECIRREKDANYFAIFDDVDISKYLTNDEEERPVEFTPKTPKDDRWGKWGNFHTLSAKWPYRSQHEVPPYIA
ncbi:hypothetical protein Cgig2_001127 [Carnegiea gigantea]|uniref:Uncharacterized protein n=1 Tax=Carnegiea gigantea TaxID=171969 RepID=A0A9Q1Q665_9CARY|nr:hypothetical protein Cgig2_001127 [Carnegiea gigantea]